MSEEEQSLPAVPPGMPPVEPGDIVARLSDVPKGMPNPAWIPAEAYDTLKKRFDAVSADLRAHKEMIGRVRGVVCHRRDDVGVGMPSAEVKL
jgi:hypothetical protein